MRAPGAPRRQPDPQGRKKEETQTLLWAVVIWHLTSIFFFQITKYRIRLSIGQQFILETKSERKFRPYFFFSYGMWWNRHRKNVERKLTGPRWRHFPLLFGNKKICLVGSPITCSSLVEKQTSIFIPKPRDVADGRWALCRACALQQPFLLSILWTFLNKQKKNSHHNNKKKWCRGKTRRKRNIENYNKMHGSWQSGANVNTFFG